MAIGNISPAGKNFTAAAEYDLAQGRYAEQEKAKQPEILEQNFVFGKDYKDLGEQFREVADENKRVLSPVMKFSISFDPKENLSDKQKLEFTKNVMKEMGIQEDNHQYIITRHSDKGHDHHHVLANRVGLDGKAIDYSHSIPRLEKAIDKTEKEMGLNNDLAKTRRFVHDETQKKGYRVQKENFRSNKTIEKNQKPTKKKSLDQKKAFLREEITKAKAISKSPEELKKNLKEKNIDAQMRYDNSGKFTGVAFNYDNLSVKGSALGKEFKASQIEKDFAIEKETQYNRFDQIQNNKSEAEKWKIVDKEINNKIENSALKGDVSIQKMDEIIRAEVPKEFPKENVWSVIDKHGGDRYQDKLMEKSENLQKEKIVKSVEKQPEKPPIQQKEEINRFDQANKNREAKQEQNQEQEQNRNRGFRR